MTQRALAAEAGVPQPTVARIEGGAITPRVDTLERLLRAAGWSLAADPAIGIGIDRTQIRELLRLTPAQRLKVAAADARALTELESRVRT